MREASPRELGELLDVWCERISDAPVDGASVRDNLLLETPGGTKVWIRADLLRAAHSGAFETRLEIEIEDADE